MPCPALDLPLAESQSLSCRVSNALYPASFLLPMLGLNLSLMAARICPKYHLFGPLIAAASRITNWCSYAIFDASNVIFPTATSRGKSVYHPLDTTLTARAVQGHRRDSHVFACGSSVPHVFGQGVRGSRTGPQRTEKTR